MASKIKLRSSDNKIIEVDRDVAMTSSVIQGMMENCCESDPTPVDGAAAEEQIPLQVPERTLRTAMAFAEFQKNNPTEDPKQAEEVNNGWANTHLKHLDKLELFKLVEAANYLDMEQLLKAACHQIALRIMGMKQPELRTFFTQE